MEYLSAIAGGLVVTAVAALMRAAIALFDWEHRRVQERLARLDLMRTASESKPRELIHA